ncbi:MAG TPA: ABC transporter permease [Geminicoccaceae bacterium]|nr:ABC transporter permease [Geminicoccus sp.]HMU49669.1 ABC transporter permease [Geminicoccaceae bacterium]
MTALEAAAPEMDKRIEVAGPWRLFWLKFRKHKVAVVSLAVITALYLIALLADFLAPFDPDENNRRYVYAPPQTLRFVLPTEDGGWRFQPHVYGLKSAIDPRTLARSFVENDGDVVEIALFARTDRYFLAGLIPLQHRLIGPVKPRDRFYLLGADRLGRDMLSRMIHGTRVSMSIGLVGVTLSLVLGIVLGGISGYFGGLIDGVIQRVIELLQSIPTIPLWMGLAAAIPLNWPPLTVYFIITVILSLVGWTSLAREVRGKFMTLKNEDFITAARLDGISEMRIILGQMVPSFLSHIIAAVTLAIPIMILSETALSFLGIGLRSPVVSWGVLLQEAQNVRTIAQAPWLFWPGAAVVTAVLALNFLGDGLRDAADPYSR